MDSKLQSLHKSLKVKPFLGCLIQQNKVQCIRNSTLFMAYRADFRTSGPKLMLIVLAIVNIWHDLSDLVFGN